MKEEPQCLGSVCHSSVGELPGKRPQRAYLLNQLGPNNPHAQAYLQPADVGEILWGVQRRQERVKNLFAWALFKTIGCIRI